MKATLVAWLFDLAARLPLRLLHWMGALLGRLMYLLDRRYAARLRENLGHACAGMPESSCKHILSENINEMGKSICELPWVWRRPLNQVLGKVQACHGLEHLEAARQHGRGIIYLTPHLGCFEIVALYLAAQMPMTIMYRPPRLPWLDEVMRSGRMRGQTTLARTDISGVRAMFKALKRGEAIGLLPDQAPGSGEGEWAPFFGRPAYTMTLVGRLAESSGATILLSYGERLPHGAGYALHFTPLEFGKDEPITRQLNAELEKIIRACPEQYLWSYNRYKIPAGANPPEEEKEVSA
ncbi:MAG TPA: lysophospholipid acyltransferase family protein [Gallionellaceae bacterium]